MLEAAPDAEADAPEEPKLLLLGDPPRLALPVADAPEPKAMPVTAPAQPPGEGKPSGPSPGLRLSRREGGL